ncbi:Aldose reductase [Entamoeba marina]
MHSYTQPPILSFPLNNGNYIPALGLGTFLSQKYEIGKSILTAINNGYRHIDTASYYNNEEEIGEILQLYLKEGKILREEIFVTVRQACEESLKKLRLKYLDLYLIHHFVTLKDKVSNQTSLNKDDFITIPIEETWRQMEKLVEDGLVKSIGVSNFPIHQLEKILRIAKIKPVVNQVEFNVYFQQPNLAPYCKENHIHITAHSPLGSNSYGFRTPLPSVFNDIELQRIAIKHNKTIAQVILKFIIQKGHSVIPKSVKTERIYSNSLIIDWILDENDIISIEKLNKNIRVLKSEGYYEALGLTYREFWGEDEINE